MKQVYKKLIIIALILIANIVLWSTLDIKDLLSIETVQHHRDTLCAAVCNHYWLAILTYIGVYFASTALALPGSALITMVGGFLFGAPVATALVVIGATLGGTSAFLTVRYILGASLQKKYGAQLTSFNEQIARNGVYYMIAVRLNPIAPFFIINTLAGLTLLPARTFIWTTACGIIPVVFLYAYIGRKLMLLNTFTDIFSFGFILAATILTLLAIVPLLVTWRKNRKRI